MEPASFVSCIRDLFPKDEFICSLAQARIVIENRHSATIPSEPAKATLIGTRCRVLAGCATRFDPPLTLVESPSRDERQASIAKSVERTGILDLATGETTMCLQMIMPFGNHDSIGACGSTKRFVACRDGTVDCDPVRSSTVRPVSLLPGPFAV